MYFTNYRVIFMNHILFENHRLEWLKMELRFYLKKIYPNDFKLKYDELVSQIQKGIGD
jgi:hypothetical protein